MYTERVGHTHVYLGRRASHVFTC